MHKIRTVPNPELEVGEDNKTRWSRADDRRQGWHNLHRIARYSISLRAARTMLLVKRMDLAIAELEAVRHFTALPWFSAMIVIRDQDILFERYATDFDKDRPHSIQSITKTTMNLVIGQLVEQGILNLSHNVSHYIPEIGSGYADATLQQVLNMDVVNDYTEDFADPRASYYAHEEAMGWRLPRHPDREETQRGFTSRIASADTKNRSGHIQYKDANTDVLAWVVERATGRPLRAFLADIVDAAGLEGALHITTDREGVPAVDGGASLTARDLARYMAIFVRRGRGISGEAVGSNSFIERSLSLGVPMPAPLEWVRYSNHVMVTGRALGHGGWGGQYAMANLETRMIAVFFSVIESQHAITRDYLGPVIRMLLSITGGRVECIG
jgi:CubicO group peptidase (beta-lactamase class C family)